MDPSPEFIYKDCRHGLSSMFVVKAEVSAWQNSRFGDGQLCAGDQDEQGATVIR